MDRNLTSGNLGTRRRNAGQNRVCRGIPVTAVTRQRAPPGTSQTPVSGACAPSRRCYGAKRWTAPWIRTADSVLADLSLVNSDHSARGAHSIIPTNPQSLQFDAHDDCCGPKFRRVDWCRSAARPLFRCATFLQQDWDTLVPIVILRVSLCSRPPRAVKAYP